MWVVIFDCWTTNFKSGIAKIFEETEDSEGLLFKGVRASTEWGSRESVMVGGMLSERSGGWCLWQFDGLNDCDSPVLATEVPILAM